MKQQSRRTAHRAAPLAPARSQPWVPVLVLVLLVMVFFRDLLLQNTFLWEDFLYFSYPVRSFAATSLAMGQIPLWNPYTFSGMPFLADIQTTVFYLPCTVLTLFVHGNTLSFYSLELVIVSHYVLAGLGMYLLARSLPVGVAAALFASVAYMLSGFMITHAIHQQIVTLVAWFPLILWTFRKALLSWLWVFVTALLLGHSLLAGYPQLSLYFYILLGGVYVYEVLIRFRGKGLLSLPATLIALRALSVVVLSLGVALVQFLPTWELADLSQRASITYEKASEGSLAWEQLLTLLQPKMFGTSGAGGYNYVGPGTYWAYWETCVYMGILPLFLALLAPLAVSKRRLVVVLWIGIGVCLLYALGNNFVLHRLAYNYLPGFSKFRDPARVGVFISLAVSLLSALTLEALAQTTFGDAHAKRLRKAIVGLGLVSLAVWGLATSGALLPVTEAARALAAIKRDAGTVLAVALVSCAFLYFAPTRASLRRWGASGAIGILFLDLLLFGGDQNNGRVNPSVYFKGSESLVRFLKSDPELFRVNTRCSEGMIMDRNQAMVDRIFTMEGYTPLALQRAFAPVGSADQLFDLMNVKYKTVSDGRQIRLVAHPTHLPRAFFLYSVRVTTSDDELLAALKDPAFDHRKTAILEKDPGFTFGIHDTLPTWSAHITGYEDNKITLEAATSAEGLLVLSEIYYPGWKAYVDGNLTEIYRADYNLRSLRVPAGSHQVIVRFEPDTFRIGAMVSAASVLTCAGGIAFGLYHRRRRPA